MIPFEDFLANVAQSAFSTIQTMRATYLMAKDVLERGIPGDLVECGVAAGSNAAMIARAVQEHYGCVDSPGRRVHLFDNFTGVPAPGPEDKAWIAAGHPVGTSGCSLENVKRNMRRWGIPDELLVYHEGMFQDTVPFKAGQMQGEAIKNRRDPHSLIALLRLDGDLYDSTLVCLELLYPMVSRGGWVIIDDYELDGCRKAVHEYMHSEKVGGFPPISWEKL